MTKLEKPILMATIGAAQGLRGEVRVQAHCAEPLALGDYGRLYSDDGTGFEILDMRPAKNGLVVRFRGINDRNAAEALNGIALFIERDSLADDDLEDDEFFYADLEGLEAVDATGKIYGTVSAVYDFGGGDLLELQGGDKRTMLIPFSEAAVIEIDLTNNRIVVDPVAAGLVEEEGPGSRRRQPPKSDGNGKGSGSGRR